MEIRINQMISTLINNGKMTENEQSHLEASLKNIFDSCKKISCMNVGDRYLDMTVYTVLGVGSDRVYIVKKDNDNKWYVLDAYKNILNKYI